MRQHKFSATLYLQREIQYITSAALCISLRDAIGSRVPNEINLGLAMTQKRNIYIYMPKIILYQRNYMYKKYNVQIWIEFREGREWRHHPQRKHVVTKHPTRLPSEFLDYKIHRTPSALHGCHITLCTPPRIWTHLAMHDVTDMGYPSPKVHRRRAIQIVTKREPKQNDLGVANLRFRINEQL